MSKGFIQIRRGLEEHLLAGSIGYFELGIYLVIHLQVDFESGVWIGSAPRLVAAAPRATTLRDIQRALARLAEIGFIRVFHRQGSRGNYRVLIHKYEPQSGALRGRRLNAVKSADWSAPVYEPCAEGALISPKFCAEDVSEPAPYLKEEQEQKQEIEEIVTAPLERKPKRAIPFLEGFALDAEMIAFANECGVDPNEEFSAFRDYHQSRGNVFKDWKAAWRTWVRNAKKFKSAKESNYGKANRNSKSNIEITLEGYQQLAEQQDRPD